MEIPLYIHLFKDSISDDLKTVLLDIQKEHNNIHIEYVQPNHLEKHKLFTMELLMENFTYLQVMEAAHNPKK